MRRERCLVRGQKHIAESLERRRLLVATGGSVTPAHVPGLCSCAGCQPQTMDSPTLADVLKSTVPTVRALQAGGPENTVPSLSSRPSATRKLFIDFDGAPAFDWVDTGGNVERAHGAGGDNVAIPAFTIDADRGTLNDDEVTGIRAIWRHVAEKFSTFDVDVTTNDPGVYIDGVTARVIVGGSNTDWNSGGGGVAAINGFNSAVDNTSFVWSDNAIAAGSTTLLDRDRHFLGETVAHEAGHTFGLRHQQPGNGTVTTGEYFDGDATTVPVMGNSSNQQAKMGRWWITNMVANQQSPQTLQNDIAVLGQTLGFISDDQSGAPSPMSSTIPGLFNASGVISAFSDTDRFVFTATGASGNFVIRNAVEGGMLTPRMELRTWPGNVAVSASSSTTLTSQSLSTNALQLGAEYVIVARNDALWGSIGQYSVAGMVQRFANIESDGTLRITGFDGANDDINLEYLFINGQWQYYVDLAYNGDNSQLAALLIPAAFVQRIYIDTFGGNDTVRYLDSVLPVEVRLFMGEGNDSFTILGNTTNDTVTVFSNRVQYGSHITSVEEGTENLFLRTNDGNDLIDIRSWANGQIDIAAGNGFDTLRFDDSDRTTNANYGLVGSTIVTQPISGGPSTINPHSGVEDLKLFTGSGNNQVRLSVTAPGLSSLYVNTGAGDDWVFGDNEVYADFGASISSGIAMGAGNDRLSIRNVNAGYNAYWRFEPDRVVFDQSLFPFQVFHYDTERFDLDGGWGNDEMIVTATNADQVLTLRGGAGHDAYNTFDPVSRRTDSIRSRITINDASGTDTLRADNAGKPDTGGLGDWLHITEGVLSHTTNDRFFAPGGRVIHSGIDLLRVQTSQAVDYAVVTPSPNYVIDVYDSNIVNTPGDNVSFALAGVDDPQYVDLLTIWRLTSTNRMNVNVSGFEFPTLGSEVPAVTQAPAPVFDGPEFYLNVAFSVPMDIFTFGSGEAFTVENLTTGQTLAPATMLATDSGVNGFFITFPSYENGLPPDGRYRITLRGDYVRSVNYNPMGADQAFDFAILRGDADNNGLVDFADLLILAQNYGQAGRTFSQGNFDYSAGGTVDFSDLLVLAQRYGSALPLSTMTRKRSLRGSRGGGEVLA